MKPNSEYSIMAPEGLPAKVMKHQRRRIYERFLAESGIGGPDTVLDVGVTADQSYDSSNHLEVWYPDKTRITATGLDDASVLETLYPGLTFVQGDGRELPFTDRQFDFVHSSAVLEHVGGFQNQGRFISECARVARKGFFLTTPNRWYPIEFHTILPLVHWLPKPMFRGLIRGIGKGFFADEGNLNLVGPGELGRIIASVDLSRFDVRVSAVSLVGWPANLLIIGRARG